MGMISQSQLCRVIFLSMTNLLSGSSSKWTGSTHNTGWISYLDICLHSAAEYAAWIKTPKPEKNMLWSAESFQKKTFRKIHGNYEINKITQKNKKIFLKWTTLKVGVFAVYRDFNNFTAGVIKIARFPIWTKYRRRLLITEK